MGARRGFRWRRAAFALGTFLVPAVRATTPVVSDPSSSDLRRSAEQTLHVRNAEIVEIDAALPFVGPIRFPVSIDATTYTVELFPASVRAPGYQLFVQGPDGEIALAAPSEVRIYRGRLVELADSAVAASSTERGLSMVVIFPDGMTFAVEPIADRVPGALAGQHVLYPHDASQPPVGACATPDEHREPPSAAAVEGGVASGTVVIAQLAIDADVEYYQRYGSVAAVEAQVHSIINTVNVQYERDLGARHIITTIIVRTAEPDPYSGTSVGQLINQFRDKWNASHTSIVRDEAQLFTGKNLDGTGIGIAFTNSLCFRDAAYSVVQSDTCVTFACKTDLSAHELGHVWSANHCTCPGWTMNPTITSANRFHPVEDIPGMLDFLDTRACLSFADKCDATGTIDCNENGVADDCDLSSGTSTDVDVNGTPDECQPPPTPGGEPASNYRNRTIAMSVPTAPTVPPGTLTALRVRLTSLQHPDPPNAPSRPPPDFSAYEDGDACTDPAGCVRWVGPPQAVGEFQDRPAEGGFIVARLQCTPFYHDWTTVGLFHVVGAEIMSSSGYNVENLSPRCAGREETCAWASLPYWYTTARFADIAEPFDPPDFGSQPDALDVAALVNKFKGLPGSPSKSFALLQGNAPDWNGDVSALDIAACVGGFRGDAYPYPGPCPCPSTVTCNTVPCSTPAVCNGGTCIRTCLGGDLEGVPCTSDAHCPNSVCGPGYCRDRCARCGP